MVSEFLEMFLRFRRRPRVLRKGNVEKGSRSMAQVPEMVSKEKIADFL